jgi:hypothetical protein
MTTFQNRRRPRARPSRSRSSVATAPSSEGAGGQCGPAGDRRNVGDVCRTLGNGVARVREVTRHRSGVGAGIWSTTWCWLRLAAAFCLADSVTPAFNRGAGLRLRKTFFATICLALFVGSSALESDYAFAQGFFGSDISDTSCASRMKDAIYPEAANTPNAPAIVRVTVVQTLTASAASALTGHASDPSDVESSRWAIVTVDEIVKGDVPFKSLLIAALGCVNSFHVGDHGYISGALSTKQASLSANIPPYFRLAR